MQRKDEINKEIREARKRTGSFFEEVNDEKKRRFEENTENKENKEIHDKNQISVNLTVDCGMTREELLQEEQAMKQVMSRLNIKLKTIQQLIITLDNNTNNAYDEYYGY